MLRMAFELQSSTPLGRSFEFHAGISQYLSSSYGTTEAYSDPCQIFNMQRFAKLIKGF